VSNLGGIPQLGHSLAAAGDHAKRRARLLECVLGLRRCADEAVVGVAPRLQPPESLQVVTDGELLQHQARAHHLHRLHQRLDHAL